MPINLVRAKKLVSAFDFKPLFIDELGWEHHDAQLEVLVDCQTLALSAVAQKRGMAAFICGPDATGLMPDGKTRRKIERQVARSAHEHLIIFIDKKHTTQVWQWVRREQGKPLRFREHLYRAGQPGDSLVQKLQALAVSFEEEEVLTLPDITGRARRAFDVERVTKRFYDRFKAEHAAFLKFLEGIPDKELERWYVSVMLNRLMFIYFIQKKGFLNSDHDYLKNKLAQCRTELGKDRYYRDFLCPLFFEGFAKRKEDRSGKAKKLLGEVPYLNGGIFMPHQIEQFHGKSIVIPDKAFVKLFEFFDAYQWHLDERPLRRDDEINPDVLGYIFEKYINQKQMGAYYSKEDITGYISKNTVIPFLFDAAREKCKVAFESAGRDTTDGKGESSVWRLLRDDPDRYFYPAMKHGVDLPLPSEIAEGLETTKPDLIERRKAWNKPAPPEFALPTEIWREVVARRKRYEEVRAMLAAEEVHSIDDLITYNLDIQQFAQDVIENCEGPELLVAFWKAIESVTVLDPTCGSGAFLFAALNILDPLYEACLERMEFFLGEWADGGKKNHPIFHDRFNKTLRRVEDHPNYRYFVLKSIIVNNLYGVDIMEEAVEICKLRLFLKLVAQIERIEDIEPLPDIDFNIRAGNTLVGFSSLDEVKKTMEGDWIKLQSLPAIEEEAEIADRAFQQFRKQQTELGGTVTAEDKKDLSERLDKLAGKLNQFLAGEYGIALKKKDAFEKWLASHKPFHWFAEFYGILKAGGFDVIIGNPPYLETREVDYALKNYSCLDSRAIHAMCIERSSQLLHESGCMSMIVPLALPSTQRMQVVQNLLEENRNAWYANYAWRPGKLFDTVNRALTVFVVSPSDDGNTFSTNYQKWTSDNRTGLFERLTYIEVPRNRPAFWVPKVGDNLERSILEKCLSTKTIIGRFVGHSEQRIYYRTTGGLYWKVFTDFAPKFRLNGRPGQSSRETCFALSKREHIRPIIAALSSDIFWWWYTLTSNLRDLNPSDIKNFPLPITTLSDQELQSLGKRYLKDIEKNSTMLVREQRQTGRTETQSFKIQKSKPIIDEIDRVLAKHYGLTEEELDFIINYDIKYRMGQDAFEESDE